MLVLDYDAHGTPSERSHKPQADRATRLPLIRRAYARTANPSTATASVRLRLRSEAQFGFRRVEWLKGIEFINNLTGVSGGSWGYNQGHEFFRIPTEHLSAQNLLT